MMEVMEGGSMGAKCRPSVAVRCLYELQPPVLRELRQLPLASEKRAQVGGQVASGALALAADRRKSGWQVRRANLVNADRFDALEMVFAEIGQLERCLNQIAGQSLHGDVRQQDLIGVCRALQSRGCRQRRAEIIVLAARASEPGVNPEPELEAAGRPPRSVAHFALRLDGRQNGVQGLVED